MSIMPPRKSADFQQMHSISGLPCQREQIRGITPKIVNAYRYSETQLASSFQSKKNVVTKQVVELSDDDEEDNLGSFGTDLDRLINKNTVAIPESNPFFGTDLVVFSDEFPPNSLPLNGIHEPQFMNLTTLYNKICKGKTKFVIEGDTKFKDLVLDSIKVLLTRRLGRELFKGLLQESGIKKIQIVELLEGEEDFDKKTGIATVGFNRTFIDDSITQLADGQKAHLVSYHFIDLGHELIHVLHEPNKLIKEAPTFGKRFFDLEEQVTITGLEKSLPTQFSDDPEELLDFTYNEINENNLRSVFGLGYRISHEGITIKKPENLSLASDEVSTEIKKYFLDIVDKGLVADIEEFLSKNPDIGIKHHDLLSEAIIVAIKADELPAFRLILEKRDENAKFGEEGNSVWRLCRSAVLHSGIKTLNYLLDLSSMVTLRNKTDSSKNNLLHYLLKGFIPTEGIGKNPVKLQLLQLLIDAEINPNQENSAGETPLILATNLGWIEGIKLLINAGAKVNAINKNGQSASTLAIQKRQFKISKLLIKQGFKQRNVSPIHADKVQLQWKGPTTWKLITNTVNKFFGKSDKIKQKNKSNKVKELGLP